MLFSADLEYSARDKKINDIRIMMGNIPNHLQLRVSFMLTIGIVVLTITWLPLLLWFKIKRITKNG